MTAEPRRRSVEIDVGRIVRRSVASLYSHLVTRPTGRAVRLAIETQLAEVGDTAFSVIDLSEVTVLDFSCADEVVAKLLSHYLEEDRPRDAFFVFRGVGEMHRDPIEVVLERRRLAAVAETLDGTFELVGSRTEDEVRVWRLVEDRGRLTGAAVRDDLAEADRTTLERLVERRLVFRVPPSGDVHALSRLVGDLAP